MRSNIDPMTPTTSTLAPAVAHIVDTAAALSKNVPRNNTPLRTCIKQLECISRGIAFPVASHQRIRNAHLGLQKASFEQLGMQDFRVCRSALPRLGIIIEEDKKGADRSTSRFGFFIGEDRWRVNDGQGVLEVYSRR